MTFLMKNLFSGGIGNDLLNYFHQNENYTLSVGKLELENRNQNYKNPTDSDISLHYLPIASTVNTKIGLTVTKKNKKLD